MEINWTEIIAALLVALMGVAIAGIKVLWTGTLKPWIESKTTEQQRETIHRWVEVAVKAAEELFDGEGRGSEKRDYVISQIEQRCMENGIAVDVDYIRQELETAFRQYVKG